MNPHGAGNVAAPSPPSLTAESSTFLSSITSTTQKTIDKTSNHPQHHNNFRSILDQFSDISRYANIIAGNIQSSQPSQFEAVPVVNDDRAATLSINDETNVDGDQQTTLMLLNQQLQSHTLSPTMMSAQKQPPNISLTSPFSALTSNATMNGGNPPLSSSSLSDVLSSLMGLSEEEWRTLRDSMRFLHTTTTTTTAHSILVGTPSSPYISPEDVLAGIDSTLPNSGTVMEPWLTLLPIIYWMLIILGVVGNSIVILVYIFGRQWRSDLSVYLVNLAVADAMLAIFCLPFTMNQVIEHEWPYSDWMCDLVFYLQLASVLSSVYTLVVIGVDRYMFIIYQKKNRRMSKTTKLLVIIIGWLVTFSICTVQIFVADVHAIVDERTGRIHRSCSENLGNMNVAYTIAIFLLTYAIPLVVLASAYYLVGRKLSQMMSEVPDDASPGGATAATGSQNWSNTNNIPNTAAGGTAAQQHTPLEDRLRPKYGQPMPGPLSPAVMLPGKKIGATATSVAACAAAAYGPRAAAAAAHVPPNRLQLRTEFLRLDPRYNLCRTPEMKRIRQKRRIVRMLVVLVILFAISWLPLHSFFLLFTFFEHWFHVSTPSTANLPSKQENLINGSITTAAPTSRLNPELIQLVFIPSHVLAMSSCCVNPIVYCFMSRRFRNDLVKLYYRSTSALVKMLKKVCCYCCTRDDSEYWSHASSFHVVGAVMDEDDGSYAICTTCKDHQHHHNDSNHDKSNSIKLNSMTNGHNHQSDSMMDAANGISSRSAHVNGDAGRGPTSRSAAGSSVILGSTVKQQHETTSFCETAAVLTSGDARRSPDTANKTASDSHQNRTKIVEHQHPAVDRQSSQDHDLFMASYPLKLSHKDFVKLFSKPIDHKMIRQLSGSINWSHGPISTTGRGETVSDVAPDANSNSKAAKASTAGADSAVVISEKNPMACFYMCTTCGHLYPVFTNKMPNMASVHSNNRKHRSKSPKTENRNPSPTTTSGHSTASTRLPLFLQRPSSITHSVSSSSHHHRNASSHHRHKPSRSHQHESLLRTSSLTFGSNTDHDNSSSSTAGRHSTLTSKRDCASCIVGHGGSSSLGSSGGASSCITTATTTPRVVLERCSSTRVHSGGNAEPSSSALRPVLPQQQQIHPILLKKQCSACKNLSNEKKKKAKTANGNSNRMVGHAVSSTSSRNGVGGTGISKPYKSPKELYD